MNKHNESTSFGIRFLSGLIDFLILSLPLVFMIYIFSTLISIESILSYVFYGILFLILSSFFVFINVFLVSRFGATIGKMATGTAIVDLHGKHLSFGRAFIRNYVGYYFVSGFLFGAGFLWILRNKEKRGFHDLLSDSYVKVINPQGWITGLVVLGIVLALQGMLFMTSFKNTKSNIPLYKEIITDIKIDIEKESQKKEKEATLDETQRTNNDYYYYDE